MYTLSHNYGEATFHSLHDAIVAMYLLSIYDSDCEAIFTQDNPEIDLISKKVECGEYYVNGIFTLFKSE